MANIISKPMCIEMNVGVEQASLGSFIHKYLVYIHYDGSQRASQSQLFMKPPKLCWTLSTINVIGVTVS